MNIQSSIRHHIGNVAAIPPQGARIVRLGTMEIAVFRTRDGEVFALENRCPHRGGPLSDGIVHGRSVTCPLHNWVINLATGEAEGADSGCVRTARVEVDADGAMILDVAALLRRTAHSGEAPEHSGEVQ